MGGRGRGMVLPRKKPHLSHSVSRSGGITKLQIFSWGVKDLSSTSGTPTLRSCTGKTSSQNSWLWKHRRNMEYVQKNYRTAGNRKPTFKGPMCKFTWCANQHKNTKLKSAWTTGEEDPLTNLLWCVCQRGRTQLGYSLWSETLAGAIFKISGYLADDRAGRRCFEILYINC